MYVGLRPPPFAPPCRHKGTLAHVRPFLHLLDGEKGQSVITNILECRRNKHVAIGFSPFWTKTQPKAKACSLLRVYVE